MRWGCDNNSYQIFLTILKGSLQEGLGQVLLLHHCLGGQDLQVVELCEAVQVGGGQGWYGGGWWTMASHVLEIRVGQGGVCSHV